MQSILDLGADVDSRYVMVACAADSFKPHRIANERKAIRAWLRTVPRGSRLAMESTAGYHEVLADLAHQAGLQVFILNARDVHRYGEGIGRRGKTDRLDAEVIARYIAREHQELLKAATPIELNDAVKVKAADRALSRKAPCHQNKNSMADAVLIETYFECVRKGKPGERFAFVTHNHTDFSQVAGNRKLPHADLAHGFTKIKSLYFITLSECLRRIDPHLVTDVMFEYGYEQEPRTLSEMLEATDRLTTQVWHNRHMNLQWAIDHGRHKIVTHAEWDANSPPSHLGCATTAL